MVGGWQITNTLNYSSGLPWTASIGECGLIEDTGPCRPNLVPGQSFNVGPKKINGQWYDFTPVAPLAYNRSVRHRRAWTPARWLARRRARSRCLLAARSATPDSIPSSVLEAFFSDMALSKNFTITERIKAQFRFDAYNVFNHPVLGFNSNQGNTCVDCGGNAGQITDIEADASPGSPTGMRQLQFGAARDFLTPINTPNKTGSPRGLPVFYVLIFFVYWIRNVECSNVACAALLLFVGQSASPASLRSLRAYSKSPTPNAASRRRRSTGASPDDRFPRSDAPPNSCTRANSTKLSPRSQISNPKIPRHQVSRTNSASSTTKKAIISKLSLRCGSAPRKIRKTPKPRNFSVSLLSRRPAR